MAKPTTKAPAQLSPAAEMAAAVRKSFASQKLPDPTVAINEEDFLKSLPHLSSGVTMIDYLIGGIKNRFGVPPCPGLPKGKIVHLYGKEASGKTTLALTACAKIIAQGGWVVYVDWENAIVPDYSKALGVPVDDKDKFILYQPSTLEQGIQVIWTGVKRGCPLIVIDSVGAAITNAVLAQKDSEKGRAGQVGAVARAWSDFLPQARSLMASSGTCILGISQLRKTINTTGYGQGDGSDTQGGQAWKFYSDVRISLAKIKSEKTKEYNIIDHTASEEMSSGAIIRARADKCKISASQGREVQFYIRHGEGIDDLRSIIEFAINHGLVRKDGSWFQWQRGNGDILKEQGFPKFREAIVKAVGGVEEIYRLATDKLYASTDGLVSPDDKAEEEDIVAEIENILSGKNADGTDVFPEDTPVGKDEY